MMSIRGDRVAFIAAETHQTTRYFPIVAANN
jgi:hypothetical protein